MKEKRIWEEMSEPEEIKLKKRSTLAIFKEIFLFSWPLILGQLGQMLIGAGDVWVAAKHKSGTVAAIGLATGLQSPIFIVGLGLLMGLSPYLAHKRGKGEEIESFWGQCLVYSFVLSLVFTLISLLLVPLVPFMGFDPQLVPLIQEYLFITSWSFSGAYVYHGLKEFLQAQEKVLLANIIAIMAIFINVLVNYALVFGLGPFPELGAKGLAVASFIIRLLMGAFLLIWTRPRAIHSHKIHFMMSRRDLSAIWKLSAPLALAIFLEVTSFCTVTFLIGRMSILQAAAHQLVLTLASITFMVPLAISSAVAVKVANAMGRQQREEIQLYAQSALLFSLLFMTLSGITFSLFPLEILGFFTQEKNLLSMGAKLLLVAAAFQLFDGAQVTLGGILRGLGHSRPTFYMTLVGHWVIGLPLGMVLAYWRGWESQGLWAGLAISLAMVSLGLGLILRRKLKAK